MRPFFNILIFINLSLSLSFAQEIRLSKDVSPSGYYDCRATTQEKAYVCQLIDLNKKIAAIYREYNSNKSELTDPRSCGFNASGTKKLTREEKELISDLIFAAIQKNKSQDTNLSSLGSDMENIQTFVMVGRPSEKANSIVKLIYSSGAPQFYIDSMNSKKDSNNNLVYIPQRLLNLELGKLSKCVDDWTSVDRDFERLAQLPKEVYEGYLKLLNALEGDTETKTKTLKR